MASDVDSPALDIQIKGSQPFSSSSGIRPLNPSSSFDVAPSSSLQIYSNLLVLEASLRSQYLNHLARRRKFSFFVFLLFTWVGFFFYRLFLLGGSPYYYIYLFEKLGLGGGAVTAVLYYATGLYDKTIVEPRRFVSMANRGLRGFNVKLVKVPLSSRDWLGWWWNWYLMKPPPRPAPVRRRFSSNATRRPTPNSLAAPSVSSVTINRSLSPHPEEDNEEEVEEFLPGGMHMKLVILPKGFSPDFREGWEIYRSEYWEKENESRAQFLEDHKKRNHIKAEDQKHLTPERRTRSASKSVSGPVRALVSETDGLPSVRVRRGSGTGSVKKRSNLRSATPSDISDSGSTTSAVGERRTPTPTPSGKSRRSESTIHDRSSPSVESKNSKLRKKGQRRAEDTNNEERTTTKV